MCLRQLQCAGTRLQPDHDHRIEPREARDEGVLQQCLISEEGRLLPRFEIELRVA